MKPEAQRIAIAAHCISKPDLCSCGLHWKQSDGKSCGNQVPDYLNDLNAMHEAEKELSNEQCDRYETFLIRAATGIEVDWITGKAKQITSCQRYSFHATAAQRAEAFLKTIGKWTE